MTKQHFFMFSQGSYSDYMVGGLYACDHEVSEAEWREHCEKYYIALENKRTEVYKAFGERTGYGTSLDYRGMVSSPKDFNQCREYNGSIEYHNLKKWEAENDPEKTFQEMHNMVPVEHNEMHRGW
jgi:hypothetical protein